ncbi:MAG: YoaK family protein [Novosphingobium sp.]
MDTFDRPRQSLAIALAFLAGFVDALGFLSGDRYFVSFMSGNTTRLAVDLVTAPARALTPALLVVGFVAGVAAGSLVAAKAGAWRKPVLIALVAALLFAAAAWHAIGQAGAGLGAMVFAMGAVNNAFQRNGEVAVGVTYMTGALVKLGQGIGAALAGERRAGWTPHLLLWSGLFAGGVSGAVLFHRFGGGAIGLAALLASALAWWAWRIARRDLR